MITGVENSCNTFKRLFFFINMYILLLPALRKSQFLKPAIQKLTFLGQLFLKHFWIAASESICPDLQNNILQIRFRENLFFPCFRYSYFLYCLINNCLIHWTEHVLLLLLMMMMNLFLRNGDLRKALSVISSRKHYQRFSDIIRDSPSPLVPVTLDSFSTFLIFQFLSNFNFIRQKIKIL